MFEVRATVFPFLFLFVASAQADLPKPITDAEYYDFGAPPRAKVELGRLLFFDKLLSGNQNISCATCHHPNLGSGDALSLPVGEGARGLGTSRGTGAGDDAIVERVPRNAPALFNLGARTFTHMFHDGRLAVDGSQPSGFQNPAGDDLPLGLETVLAAQAMFPVTSATEMAGQAGENSVADAAALGNLAGPGGVWQQLADRLRANPEYVALFTSVFADVGSAADIQFLHAANAIAAFENVAFRADQSPFDRYLSGESQALSARAMEGLDLFYGVAGCGGCHEGSFLTDGRFYSIALPQIGPGKGDGPSTHEDFGRERVSGLTRDRYRFRVPSLRNVALTGPWGHDGAFGSLERMLRHHLDPVNSLEKYDPDEARLAPRGDLDLIDVQTHEALGLRNALAASNDLAPVSLSDRQVAALMDFLHALTDPASLDQSEWVPARVPSGLPLAD
ncbi:MAG: cytochrome-c peroxidase [Gammaproteobacteria bacterium]